MSKTHFTLTHERLKEILDYNAETGVFTWKVSTNGRAKVGSVAGCKSGNGYLVIKKENVLYRSHRLAWFYVHGAWPSKDIDHIDGNKGNNAIANLREADQTENQQNLKRAKSHSSSGLLGISFDKANNRWKAAIQVNKKRRHLGRFDTKEEASAAYLVAKRELHKFGTI